MEGESQLGDMFMVSGKMMNPTAELPHGLPKG
jgi:hypothetical protein